jgi:hypothetical protein
MVGPLMPAVKMEAEMEMCTFNEIELQIFAEARTAGNNLRRGFENFVTIGRATQVARQHADAAGGSHMARGKRIMEDQGLSLRRNESSQLLRVMAKLHEVQKWRETLTPFEQGRWSSPQSIENRCPALRHGRPPKGPTVKARPMSLSELLKMPSAQAAELLYRRCPSKAWALRRSLDELLDGSVRVVSGWAAARAAKTAREELTPSP